ncbi:ATP-grasp domain-containing protein [Paenibacillus sp. BIHB 4019]|uniref:ATP-grasp domain-containing protein n=1 Tax=Paenibacillus sp. BIHB 4019 TaxID=1870819 RepID=UPI000C14E17E|nr:ATP-grasp domain-containing protein [Paenibacillus sp. BIHB 4019]
MNIKTGQEQEIRTGRRILITGGRAPAALDLARQLAEQGYEVYAADSMASPLIRFSTCIKRYEVLPAPRVDEAAFGKALAAMVEKYSIELLIPTCEEIYYIAKLRGKLGSCMVFTDEAEKLTALHSKWAFIEMVREAGLAAPETKQLRCYTELKQLHNSASEQIWVLKPVYSRFATKVHIWHANESPPPAAELQLSADSPWVAQAYVAGQEYCTYSIAKEGKLLAYSDYAVDFTAGRGASTFFQACHQPQLRQWVETFAAHTQFTGQIAFDFIIDESGAVWPLECNPRATSGLHLFDKRDRLGRALWGTGQRSSIIMPQQSRGKMIAAAMLAYGLSQQRRQRGLWRGSWHWLACMAGGRDVIFSWKDPGPFLMQGYVWFDLWRRARKAEQPLIAFTTADIEWNG